MRSAAIRALADAAYALAWMADAMAEATETEADADALLPLRVAANVAATSERVVRDALAPCASQRERRIRTDAAAPPVARSAQPPPPASPGPPWAKPPSRLIPGCAIGVRERR